MTKCGDCGVCVNCRTYLWRRQNREKYLAQCKRSRERPNIKRRRADWELKRKYGISLEQYENMYSSQNGKCLTCGAEEKLHVDHCHETGKVRGLLCHLCNSGIGSARERISILQNWINYLRTNGGYHSY